MSPTFHALPGFYKILFLYIEPLSTTLPAFMVWVSPGSSWFHQNLVPEVVPSIVPPSLDVRTQMAIWQLANCYLLLGLISSLVFRAVRDALPRNPQAQERIIGASLAALAIADVTHIAATFIGLPSDLRLAFSSWNGMTHGNITVVIILFAARLAWFMGIGRTSYHEKTADSVHKSK
ncbi:hypothetical protein AX17_000156 [Amanita inopinata Kibby_2008]|nr:hypothetical protein AX17_000156 [Amanita inopinata Kibby_2008]